MKSDVIHVSNTGEGVAEAVKQTELVADFKSLSKKDSVHLLLLTEEMMGMMKALTGEQEADFWIDDDDNTFRLHLKAETSMNAEMRRNLLSASTSGDNIAAKGVMGKMRDLFNRLVEPSEAPLSGEYAAGWTNSNLSTAQAAAVAKNYSSVAVNMNVWSLNKYRANQTGEKWDELEKSIIANVADEVEIGIAEGTVEMIVYKKL